jgi:hypothetical protein
MLKDNEIKKVCCGLYHTLILKSNFFFNIENGKVLSLGKIKFIIFKDGINLGN